jgi:hypothetical protein
MRHIAGLFFAAAIANAAPIQWTFGSGSLMADGQEWSVTQSGVTATITAWSLNSLSGSFDTASIGRYSPGMGVCNDGERASGCSTNQHTVDNSGWLDFMLFQFSTPVDPVSLFVNVFQTGDSDMNYWMGNTSNTVGLLTGVSYGNLSSLGFGAIQSSNNAGTSNSRLVMFPGTTSVNALLVAASVANTDSADYFKIRSITVEPNPVPEPATYGLIGSALLGLAILRRRTRG